MPWLAAILVVAIFTLHQTRPSSAERPPGAWRQYATVGDAGFDSAGVAAARAHAERSDAAAVLVVHHGRVAFAWGDPVRRFKTRSIRKSLLDLMFGAPTVAKAVRLDATLADLNIDDREGLTVRERSATLAHLLSARSGVYHPAAREPASMVSNRPQRGSAAPGESWFYNNWDFNALGTIYGKLTGRDIFTGFRTTIADPLGLEDFRSQDGYPIREPSRSRHAAYEFSLSARDLARIGQLVAQNGKWDGREIVSSAWLDESFRIRTPFPKGGGYGYLWWIDAGRFRTSGTQLPALDAVRDIAATGLGEQVLLVIPSLNLVFVHLTNNDEGSRSEGSAYELAELVLQARRSDPRPDAQLVPLSVERLPNEAPAPIERAAVPLSGTPSEYAGLYEVSPTVRAVVRFIDDGLFIDMPGRGEAELFQEAADRFFLKVADVVLTFERDASGAVIGVRVMDRGRALMAKKVG
jgi:CubicO group peptidase (beta-lactamase class C family)